MPVTTSTPRRLRRLSAFAAFAAFLALLPGQTAAAIGSGYGPITVVASGVKGSDGKTYQLTNHLTRAAHRDSKREWLLAWAGDADGAAGAPDFVAVIDATKGSPSYGQVVNTATFTPQLQNEPHHMQYVWHKGQRIYAGGILSDTTLVMDASQLPVLRLTGINLPADTPCGSAPDAYTVLGDGTAYATYMGGPNVAGECRYSNGETRVGNGYGGSPGEIVRIGTDGRTLSESPAALPGGEDPAQCTNIPVLPKASCANPHGAQVRPDLHRMVQTDFAEIRNYLNQQPQFDPHLIRDTVRIYDTSDVNAPKVLSAAHLPIGPRAGTEKYPVFNESRLVMETTVTNRPEHRGAFVSTMWGGAVYYTPDITAPDPQWREVFDDEAAYRTFHPDGTVPSSGDGGSWLQLSPDDRLLFHTVIGAQRTLSGLPQDTTVGMVYALDVRKLLAAGNDPKCSIDTMDEVARGGGEPDCPAIAGVLPVHDESSGGPHWGTMDNFTLGHDGYFHETDRVSRLAVANYFVYSLGGDGNHEVCMVDVAPNGRLGLDNSFRDEQTRRPCVAFDRASWPHGSFGDARPHGVLFVVNDRNLR
ncbi:MAG TPA: hypothetical protein VL738_27305 [Dactylosporangium sp.]|jgi:hypothetical protein|nr:hypothetical protein [Dactylosporangium sp.]